MMTHSKLTTVFFLATSAVTITADTASAQAIGSTVFSGISIPPPLLQTTAPPLPQPGGSPFAPNLTMPTSGVAPDVVLAPRRVMKNANSRARGHEYEGPTVILDDKALGKVR